MTLTDDGSELFSDGGILCLTRPKKIILHCSCGCEGEDICEKKNRGPRKILLVEKSIIYS